VTPFKALFRTLHKSHSNIAVLVACMAAQRKKCKEDVDEAVNAIKDAIQRNRVGYAISAARALRVLAGPDKAITRLKRGGLLRASVVGFNDRAISKIAADWIQNATLFNLSDAHVQYLNSTLVLLTLTPALRALHTSLLTRLRAERSMFKSLLAEIDEAFTFPEPLPNETHARQEMPYSNEELAEGFSYLLRLFHSEMGLAPEHFGLTGEDIGYSPRYRELLVDAAKICRYREAEVLLEGFPYRAITEANGVRVFSVDPTLERSIRLGYMQSELNAAVERHRLATARAEGKVASLPEFADKFFQKHGNHTATLLQWPAPRYRLELPMYPPLRTLFAYDLVFLEEGWSMEGLAWEEYMTPNEMPGAIIEDDITVRDVLKVQRLLGFAHHGLVQNILKRESVCDHRSMYMRSCLPVFLRADLIRFFAFAVGESKAAKLMALMTADVRSPNLDIQYAPVIVAGDYAIVSLAVLSRSNMVRNLFVRLQRRLGPVGKGDRMQFALANALRNAGFMVVEEYNLKGGANKLEVDLLAYREGVLVAFECKNTYAPCNVYEMRNTYDAIEIAGDQLTLRVQWLSDPAHQRALFARLGWAMPDALSVHTCIALGNRVFTGFECEGHPVRQTHEIINILVDGRIEFDDGHSVRVWESESFVPSDLLAYLRGTTTHADMVTALEPFDVVTSFGKMTLTQSSYVMDLLRLKESMLARYPLKD